VHKLNWRAAEAWVRRGFAQGEAYVSAEPDRKRDHGVIDSMPDESMPPSPRLGISRQEKGSHKTRNPGLTPRARS